MLLVQPHRTQFRINDGRLPYVTRRVRHVCRARRASALTPTMFGMDAPIDPDTGFEIEIGGATFCVLHVARFERIVPA